MQAGVDRVFASRKRLLKKMKDEQIDLILCPATVNQKSLKTGSLHWSFFRLRFVVFSKILAYAQSIVTISKGSKY